jgi:hypothetical protein
MLERPLLDYWRVQQWLDDFEKSWGPNQRGHDLQLAKLEQFCEFVGKNPDEIISECLRPVGDGQETIRYKVRHFYIDRIKEFEALPEVGRQGGNSIRSFLIHNGVSMGGRVLR